MSCASCPGAEIPPRILVMKKVCQSLSDGHIMVAKLYRDFVRDTSIETDKAAYEAAAQEHDAMAEATLRVVVPDDMTEEQLNG